MYITISITPGTCIDKFTNIDFFSRSVTRLLNFMHNEHVCKTNYL